MESTLSTQGRHTSKTTDVCLAVLMLGSVVLAGYLSELYGKSRFGMLELSLFFAGCLWELYRITGSMRRVGTQFCISLFLSLLITLVANKKGATWSPLIEERLYFWPFVFAICFFLVATVSYQREYTARLNESDTLLHTFAAWYLLIEYAAKSSLFYWCALLMAPLSAHSLWHAFSQAQLSPCNRFWLSFWSTVIMMVLGVVYLVRMFQQPTLYEWTMHGTTGRIIDVSLQWFLCGVAGAYITQNITMVLGYFPGKNRFFNKEYFKEIAALSALHTERYDPSQACQRRAMVVAVLSILVLYLNSLYKILDPFAAVALLFMFVSPLAYTPQEK